MIVLLVAAGVYVVGTIAAWGHVLLDRWEHHYIAGPSVWWDLVSVLAWPVALPWNLAREIRRRRRRRRGDLAGGPSAR